LVKYQKFFIGIIIGVFEFRIKKTFLSCLTKISSKNKKVFAKANTKFDILEQLKMFT